MATMDPFFFDRFMDSDRETTGSDTSGDEMSGPAPQKITKDGGKAFTTANIAELSSEILNDTFYNIIHDIVLEVHREEKVLRMRSAAVIAEKEARKATALARSAGSEDNTNDEVKPPESDPSTPPTPYVRTETEGARVDVDGKIYLKGNPLKTTPTVYCPQCKLPRLLYPTSGLNSRPPPNPTIQYCAHQPFISRPGHDVHGNPFATDKISNRGKNKKKQQEEKDKESQASSPSTDPSTPVNNSFKTNSTPQKASFPTMKCPNPTCSRYVISSRIAQHLDKCLGISGRQSSRNAMTKMSNTPQESRANTPKPSSQVLKRALDTNGSSGTAGDSPPKKKAKTMPKKKGADNKPAASSKLKNGVTVKKVTAGKTPAKKGPGRPLGSVKKPPVTAKAEADGEPETLSAIRLEGSTENGDARDVTVEN